MGIERLSVDSDSDRAVLVRRAAPGTQETDLDGHSRSVKCKCAASARRSAATVRPCLRERSDDAQAAMRSEPAALLLPCLRGRRAAQRSGVGAHLKHQMYGEGPNSTTRYDKTARNFLGTIHLAAAVIWLD